MIFSFSNLTSDSLIAHWLELLATAYHRWSGKIFLAENPFGNAVNHCREVLLQFSLSHLHNHRLSKPHFLAWITYCTIQIIYDCYILLILYIYMFLFNFAFYTFSDNFLLVMRLSADYISFKTCLNSFQIQRVQCAAIYLFTFLARPFLDTYL